MKDTRGAVTIDGFYDNVAPLSDLEREALDALPVDVAAVMEGAGLERLDEPQERPFFDRLAAWPTFTINGFHGGYGGPGTENGAALTRRPVKCDMRLIENQRVDEILDKVEAHVRRHAPEVEMIRQGGMEPSRTPLDSPYTRPLQRAFNAAQGIDPLLIPAMGGSLPDYAWTKILGVHSITTPYANHDESNHAPNE